MRRTKLSDPFIPTDAVNDADHIVTPDAISSGALVSSANRAVYTPIIFPEAVSIYALRFSATNTTGNYDLGFYNKAFGLIASTGSTAMAVGIQELTFSYRAKAGELYYAAIALSSGSGTAHRWGGSITAVSSGLPCAGVLHQSTAFPLPSTATPVFPLDSPIPIFAFGVQ